MTAIDIRHYREARALDTLEQHGRITLALRPLDDRCELEGRIDFSAHDAQLATLSQGIDVTAHQKPGEFR